MGLDPPAAAPDGAVLRRSGSRSRIVLYLGRVDRNKGCHTLLDYFVEYGRVSGARLRARGCGVTLVLAGPAKMRIPAHPRIRALGYVSDEARDALLCGAWRWSCRRRTRA